MVRVNSVIDLLPMPPQKTEDTEASDGFAREMDKATGDNPATQFSGGTKVQDALRSGEEGGFEAVDGEGRFPPTDSNKSEDNGTDVKSEVLTVVFLSTEAVIQHLETPAGQAGSPVTNDKESVKGPVLPMAADEPFPVAADGDKIPITAKSDQAAASFAKQALDEANALLEKDRGKEAVRQAGVETASKEAVDANVKHTLQPAGKKAEAANDGKEETGRQVAAKQQAITAPIREDGKVEFRLAEAQADTPEPIQSRETMLTRVVEQVKSTVTNEKSEFYLQLKPEHLGGLSILLSAEEKGVAAKLMTSNRDVQQVLQSDLTQLQAALREKGVNVVHMEVIYDQTANSTTAHNSQNGGQRQDNAFGRVHGRTEESIEDATAFYDSLSYYDVLAEQGGSVEFSA